MPDRVPPSREAETVGATETPAAAPAPARLAGVGNAALSRLLGPGESTAAPGSDQALLALLGAGGNRASAAQFAGNGGGSGGSGGSGAGGGSSGGGPDGARIPVAVHFDRPLTGEEFIRVANEQLKLDPAKVTWRNVKESYDPATSPVTVQVDAGLVARGRSAAAAAELGLAVDENGALAGASERAAELAAMQPGAERDSLHAEIDLRYAQAMGVPAGEKIIGREAEPGKAAMWDQVRDEVLGQRAYVAALPPKAQAVFLTTLDGLVVGPQHYDQIVRIAGKIERLDPADLENYLRGAGRTTDLGALEKAVDAFLATKAASGEQLKDLLAQTGEGDWDVDETAGKLDAKTMFYLPLADRIRVLKEIAGGLRVGDDDEQTIVRLLTSTPTGDLAGLVAALKADSSGLLKTLEKVIDGSESKEYYAALRGIVFGALQPEQAKQQMDDARLLPWADPGIFKAVYKVRFYYETVEYTEEGKVRVAYWVNRGPIGMKTADQVFEPDEIVGLHFFADEDFAGAVEGQTIFMPAANLIAFANEQFKRELGLVVDVGLLFAGGVGLLGKGTRLVKAIAALDTALALADLTINSFRSDIAKTAGGKTFLRAWDTVNTLIAVYGLARLVIRLPDVFRNLRRAYQEFRTAADDMPAEQLGKIDTETGKLLDKADEAITESALDDLRKRHPGDQVAPFEKQLDKAGGIADAGRRDAAIADVESQITARRENADLIAELRKEFPDKPLREIADLAAARLRVPNVPMGMDADEFARAQAFVKDWMNAKGFQGAQGYATGSRITGVTMNFKQKKKDFGNPIADFADRDLDITLITDRAMSRNQQDLLKSAFKNEFRIELGVRNIADPRMLAHQPVYGKIDLDLK